MKPQNLVILALLTLFSLQSCQPLETVAEPTLPAPFHIFLSPGSSYVQYAISECSTNLPQLSVLVEQEPQELIPVGPADWVIQHGDPVAPIAFPLGEDSIAVIVHSSNPVKSLSASDLKGIYTGFVTTWGQIDAALPEEWKTKTIQPIHLLAQEPIALRFELAVLDDEIISSRIWFAPGSADVMQEVAENPNSVGWVPTRFLSSVVKIVNPDLSGQISLLISMQKEPDEVQKKLIGCMQSKIQ